jgi:DNA-binding NtrC family response regulator
MASVLVIHERGDICDLMCPVVETAGHGCVALPSCSEALEALKTAAHDIVILDIDITENPEQAIPALASVGCRPSILVISNGNDPENLERAIRAGAWDVLCTPFTHDELVQAVNRCLFHRRARNGKKTNGEFRRDAILGGSSCLEHCLENIATVAQTSASVLILGETGTGKELFANAIHENSSRAGGNFIVVDCTNIPKTLAESLLFGHERGSFTGAADSREGLFKQADGGTIFLDEIGDLDLDVQKSLLRVLQEHKFRPLSSKREVTSDFRLVAATNRDLEAMVRKGEFRKDLYHRLRTRVIHLPPLRERKEDILPIANFHVRTICDELGCPEKEISYELHHALTLYDWPGNVRELINTLHAAVHNGFGEARLYPQHLPLDIRARVLPKRNGKAAADGYFIPGQCSCLCGDAPCQLLTPSAGGADQTEPPIHAELRPDPPAGPEIPDGTRSAPAAYRQISAAQAFADMEAIQGRSANPGPETDSFGAGIGFAQHGEHWFSLPMPDFEAENGLPPLKTVRELAMQELEALYLRQLVDRCRGNFQRALTISGLSRARLYDLLSKHSMSISGT